MSNANDPGEGTPTGRRGKPRDDDPFRYGWRYLIRPGSEGQEIQEQVPLTLDAVLHPREGDFVRRDSAHHLKAEIRFLRHQA